MERKEDRLLSRGLSGPGLVTTRESGNLGQSIPFSGPQLPYLESDVIDVPFISMVL